MVKRTRLICPHCGYKAKNLAGLEIHKTKKHRVLERKIPRRKKQNHTTEYIVLLAVVIITALIIVGAYNEFTSFNPEKQICTEWGVKVFIPEDVFEEYGKKYDVCKWHEGEQDYACRTCVSWRDKNKCELGNPDYIWGCESYRVEQVDCSQEEIFVKSCIPVCDYGGGNCEDSCSGPYPMNISVNCSEEKVCEEHFCRVKSWCEKNCLKVWWSSECQEKCVCEQTVCTADVLECECDYLSLEQGFSHNCTKNCKKIPQEKKCECVLVRDKTCREVCE